MRSRPTSFLPDAGVFRGPTRHGADLVLFDMRSPVKVRDSVCAVFIASTPS